MILGHLEQEQWHKAAPYVDTVLIPVSQIPDTDKTSLASFYDVIGVAAHKIERQLTGRVLLMPSINYIKNEAWLSSYLSDVQESMQKLGFSYVFFVVDEDTITEVTELHKYDCIEVPQLSREEFEANKQIQQLCEQIISRWREMK